MWHFCSKKDISLLKNYRPLRFLLVVSKIYKRIMQKQISEYIGKHLSSQLHGDRKYRYSTQTVSISMLQK